jgi:hypothetical protein
MVGIALRSASVAICSLSVQEWIGGNHQRADLQLSQGGKHRFELT